MLKKTIMTVIFLLVFSACSTVPVELRPDPCKNSKSFIYDTFKNPNVCETLINYAAVKAINSIKNVKQRNMTIDIAIKVIDNTQKLLNTQNLMYSDFVTSALINFDWINKYAGDEVALLSPVVVVLSSKTVPMTDCDKYLISNGLNGLKGVLLKYKT